MTETVKNKDEFNSSGFISFIFKWRKILIIVAIISIALSAFFSSPLFITPKYKATVIMFPTSSNALSRALLLENPSSNTDLLEFGQEEQAEQLLQILYSYEIKMRIIKKYNLLKHYDIDSTSKYKMTRLFSQFKNNITFRRNEFMAVEINVLDKDPQYAADIANDIAALVDTVKNNMQKKRAKFGLKIVEEEYLALQKDIQMMEDSLNSLRKLGVIDYSAQTQMINRQLAQEIARNNRSGIKALEEQLKILADYGGIYISMRDEMGYKRSRLALLRAKYDEANVDANKIIPQKFVVDNAFKPEKKAYPVRWLIVLVTTVSALLLSVIVVIITENLNLKPPHS